MPSPAGRSTAIRSSGTTICPRSRRRRRRAVGDALGSPAARRPYVGLADERIVATLIVRNMEPATATGELASCSTGVSRAGLGRRILGAFVEVLANEGFRCLRLEVAGYNGRAIAAYRASGFAVCDEYWADPEPGIDVGALLDGPAAESVSPNVRLESDGRYGRASCAWNAGSPHR